MLVDGCLAVWVINKKRKKTQKRLQTKQHNQKPPSSKTISGCANHSRLFVEWLRTDGSPKSGGLQCYSEAVCALNWGLRVPPPLVVGQWFSTGPGGDISYSHCPPSCRRQRCSQIASDHTSEPSCEPSPGEITNTECGTAERIPLTQTCNMLDM